jgi:hypothetical protein
LNEITFGPNISSIAPDPIEMEKRKKMEIAPSHAMVDEEIEESWFLP